MEISLFCITLVIIAIFFHLFSLRFRIPFSINPIMAIFFIFMVVLVTGLILAYLLNKRYSFLPHGVWENLHVLIFYVPVVLTYIITYVALEDDSPSMTIARFVAQAKEKGGGYQEIGQILTNEVLILPRLRTMVKNGWIVNIDNKYHITAKGRFYNQLFALWMKLLNIHREG